MSKKTDRITALEQANATLAAERLALVKENAELRRILDQSENGRPVQGQSLGDRVRSELRQYGDAFARVVGL